jgi:putative IMPACT (imprinted ancient) family translation regulator
VLVAVVRYFGGTLLGVPGLIQAYKEGALDALVNAEIYEKEPMKIRSVQFTYAQMNEVMKICKKHPITIVNQVIDNLCTYELTYASRHAPEIEASLDNL